MKLVFIYGQPATGKLTVAKELAKETGFDLFHNHLTTDLVHSIFPFGTEEFSSLVKKIRLDIIEAAAKAEKKGLIFTFVYGVETYGVRTDDKFINELIKTVEKYNGEVCFVRLYCAEKELQKRVKQFSRKRFGKISKLKDLRILRRKFELNAEIPFVQNLVIDNTNLTPKMVAATIKNHYSL